jgi:hypothetical protein
MRRTLKRIVATMLAAAVVGAPVSASAGDYCATGTLVRSHATGGDYIAGLLIYETMGSVEREHPGPTTTTTVTSSTEVGVGGTGITTTVSTTRTLTAETTVIGTEEPIGYYAMNDGSVYQINCLTGESYKVG